MIYYMIMDGDARETGRLAELFRLLGDPTRLNVVLACREAPRPVGEIATSLGLSASLVSHHLRLLRGARIVTSTRRGKNVLYRLTDDHIVCVIDDMVAHVREETAA